LGSRHFGGEEEIMISAPVYSVAFEGYWRETNKARIPAESGIFCVYACMHNRQFDTYPISSLLYIGEGDNVRDRIAGHEKQRAWKAKLKNGEQLCYSFGACPPDTRKECEAALIYMHKPVVNQEYLEGFPFDPMAIDLTGKTHKLLNSFMVART
jgi:hypothetical protein